MKEQKKYSLKNIIQFPVSKMIIGGLFCILIPVLINKLVLDNIFQILGFSDNLNRAVRVFITTVILMPSFYYFLFKRFENREITELQFKNSSIPITIGFLSSIAIISISFFLLVLIENIEVTEVMFPESIVVNMILILGFVIIEEIFFRGIFYRIIEGKWGTKRALIYSALVFALLHLSNENTSVMSFLSVLAGGAVLGILYTFTKNLLVPIAFHFGWNLTQVLLGFGLSGGDEFNKLYVFKLNLYGSDIITGGTSGIENSIISVIILTILFIVLYKKSDRSNRIISLNRSQ